MTPNSDKKTLIREASNSDVEGILQVQEQVLFTNHGEPSCGFLWYPLKKDEILEIIADPEQHSLIVAEDERVIQGYFLGYDLLEWQKHKPGWFESLEIPAEIREKLKTKKVFYGRHIATANKRCGVGSSLNQAFQQTARDRGYEILLVEIMKEPIENIASVSHNLKQGYYEVGTVSYPDKTLWGVFLKDL